ncbi:MAG: hypothetical protein AAGB26_13505 [Planctomycetota bacterium]
MLGHTPGVPVIPTYGLVTNAIDPVWAENSPKRLVIGDSLLAGRYELAEGGLEFTLDLGATVLIEAPTTFDIIDNNSIYLDAGRCVATAPPSAKGFTVRTASGDFVDIGTQFGVSVVEEDATEAHVFKGIVDAYLPGEQDQELARPMRLTEHTAVRSEADSVWFQKIDAEPPRFGKSVKELVDRLRTSGQVYALYSPAENLDHDRRRDGNIEVFRERAGVRLLSDVEVSFLGTGRLQSFVTAEPPTLPAGTIVDSYFIHYNVPRDQLESGIRAKGVVYFDQPIVALIYNNRLIFNSNSTLGAIGTDYGTVPADVSGIEGLDYPHGSPQFRDEIEVSPDRKSIRMNLQLGDKAIGGDNIRVLTVSAASSLVAEPDEALDPGEQADDLDGSPESSD